MLVKISTNYKGVDIEVSENIDPNNSKGRKALVQQVEWARQDVDSIMHPGAAVYEDNRLPVAEDDEEEEGDQEYLLITPNQKEYLRKLGVAEKKIKSIKTKKEASALIDKLQKGN